MTQAQTQVPATSFGFTHKWLQKAKDSASKGGKANLASLLSDALEHLDFLRGINADLLKALESQIAANKEFYETVLETDTRDLDPLEIDDIMDGAKKAYLTAMKKSVAAITKMRDAA